ncbi:signal peptidase II [Leucobacter sp. CSA1]|uniref:Lipoprotein signal peptidase n=1 Tax=Leucobacter chromiisoli TaxID=2796471 RepID=A0A934Q8E7_9MICO|nr:signal peptidase II [Leucobacter chromiisoli]
MPVLLVGVAIVVYAADQLSKNWVVENLPEGRSVPVLGEVLQWHFVRNPGAAFSMASGSTWIFTILATVVVGVILWQIRRLRSVPWAVFLGLLLGGVLGNLTDRLTRAPGFPEGHVIDFILTPWMWLGFTPAIYNIADIGIVGGMCLFVLITLLGVPSDGSPRLTRAERRAMEEAIEEETGEEPGADPEPRADREGRAGDDGLGSGSDPEPDADPEPRASTGDR